MEAAANDGTWTTKARKDGKAMDTYKAKELLRMIAESTWICGDPGMQYDTIINKWHTSSNTARINSSNPCSEYMYLDDSACNLASLNLMKFRNADDEFDIEAFRHAVDITILAQEITVDNASYPTKPIERNSHDYRPLGLGYANLGALLMSRGLPYDGDEGRNYAAAITALMQGEANLMSSKIAKEVGPFAGYARNEEPMLKVMKMHQTEAAKIKREGVSDELFIAAQHVWKEVQTHGKEWGFRNGQVSVLAPTGTIGFIMDCDTTGVEPDIALVKYKKLVGGGVIKIVNQTVPAALKNLKYSESQVKDILAYIEAHDTIEGAPHLKPEHLPVFDCAFKPMNGTSSIHYMGHVRMMGAVQPFLSGAISKTVNLPTEATGRGHIPGLYRNPGNRASRPSPSTGTAVREVPALVHHHGRRQSRSPSPPAGVCPTSGKPSPISFPSRATRVISPSASSRTALRASFSSPCRRKAPRSRASWIASPPVSPWRCSMACP